MSTHENDYYNGWAAPMSVNCVHRATSGTSGTYEASTYLDFLHVATFGQDVLILGGDGPSVTATAGQFWKAGAPYYFTPRAGRSSLGYVAADGATAFAAATPATIGVVQRA